MPEKRERARTKRLQTTFSETAGRKLSSRAVQLGTIGKRTFSEANLHNIAQTLHAFVWSNTKRYSRHETSGGIGRQYNIHAAYLQSSARVVGVDVHRFNAHLRLMRSCLSQVVAGAVVAGTWKYPWDATTWKVGRWLL